ncbi:MAG: GTP 3',8-cyclase MoaA [Azonexus sp.]
MHNETLNPESVPLELTRFTPTSSRATSIHPTGTLVDKFGRRITYVRLSITDRCDFRCTYCMAEEMTFLPRTEVMSLEECLRLANVFVGLGVSKVRITGGEPLVRKDVLWLIERLAKLPGLDNLVITTNGSQLDRFAAPLKAAGVRRINVSLDTLEPQRFREITRIGDLEKVLRGIDALREAGFTRTKLNTVMMRGVNDGEFADLVEFAIDRDLDISFIEEMPLGNIHDRRKVLTSDEALDRLSTRFRLLPSAESSGGPARYWRIPGSETRVGFISPHSHNFCDTCNRVRVTAKAELYPCLGQNDAVNLMPIMRDPAAGDADLRNAIVDCMGIKPLGHEFTEQMENPKVVRFMSMTGG